MGVILESVKKTVGNGLFARQKSSVLQNSVPLLTPPALLSL